MSTIYITTPIYYVNSKPHIGHAYTSIICDVFARYNKIKGNTVKFLTGTDEHGQKVEKSAISDGKSPQQFVDEISNLFKDLLKTVNIDNDDFIRTTQQRHKDAVQHFWKVVRDNGYIYLGEYSGWYDIRNEAFFSESELIDGKSPLGGDVSFVTEPCYFFRLSKFQDKLLQFYEDNPDFIFPASRRNEVMSFVKSGLKDLAVSRTTFKWGIEVPDDPAHVIYVWMDALVNYITALGYPEDQDMNNNPYWQNSHHFIGKEIVRFHAVYWPAFLMAAGVQLPKQIIAHGWWLSEGEKMSKSIGNVVDPVAYVNKYGSDALRYFLVREMSFGDDGNFTEESFINRYNSFLANSYGNLCSRVLSFVSKHCNSRVEKPTSSFPADSEFKQGIENLLAQADTMMTQYSFNRYAEKIEEAVYLANRYIDQEKPWSLKKTDTIRMNDVLYYLVESIRSISEFLLPIIPIAANKVLENIIVNADFITIKEIGILFPKNIF